MKTKLILGLLSIAAMIFVVTNQSTYAVSGKCYFTTGTGPVNGSGGGTCSVAGLGAYGTNDVLVGRSTSGNGSAIPSSVNTKSEFISFIQARFKSSNQQNQVGAAFIMQEMRGSTAWPSANDVKDWAARMNNSRVTVKSVWDSSVGKTSWFDSGKDNTFYADHPKVGRQVINVYLDGKVVAQIEHLCGNMVAGAVALPSPWTVTPTTTITPAPPSGNTSTVGAGSSVTWKHIINNNGPNKTDQTLTWKVVVAGSVLGGNKTGTWGSGQAKNNTLTKQYTYQTTLSDVGKTLCQEIHVAPSSSSGSSLSSTQKCVKVVSQYELDPEITLSAGEGIVDPGSVTDVLGNIIKSGGPSVSTQWQLSKIVVAPGGTIPGSATNNNTTPESHFGNTWTLVGSGTNTFTDPATQVKKLSQAKIDDLPVGTRICWALSVKPPSDQYAGWRHSAPVCLTIGKKPKLQILGGDVWARSTIRTSTSRVDQGGEKTFGSWVQYGVFSEAQNIGLASGRGLENGNANTAQTGWSNLTFANIVPDPLEDGDDSYQFGNYGNGGGGLPAVPAFVDYFSNQDSVGIDSPASVADLPSGVYKRTGSLTLNGGTIAKGRSIVIIASGTVTINSDIRYMSGSLNSLSDIPQVVILAKNIIIKSSVQHSDAWLIASGWINTCSTITNIPDAAAGDIVDEDGVPSLPDPASGKLSSEVCKNPLTINGPVATNRLYLYRTAGSGSGSAIGDPAETFNLRPDAYLWAYAHGLKALQPTTASVTELPPRF